MKHNLKCFSLLLSVLMIFNLSAQQTVFKTYFSIDSCDNNPSPIAVETEGSYIYPSFYSGVLGSLGLGLRKIDKSGNSIMFKLLNPNDSFDVTATSILKIDPKKILITGINYWRKHSSQSYAYLLLIDTNLNVLDERNDSFNGYTNELFRNLFYDYNGNLCTIHDEFNYTLNPDSMHLSIRKINLSDLSTTKIISIRGYFSQNIVKTSDSCFLIYSYSPLNEKKFYYDPVIIKFDKNWNKLWEQNLGDYGKIESGGYGITRMVELNHQYYCWRTSGIIGEIGYLYRIDEAGKILNNWREKDSSWFQTLINRGNDVMAFGNMNYYYKGDWRIALHIFDSNYNILKQNYIGFREFYDTCATPGDSTLYHMDAIKTMDGGFLIFNSGSSQSAKGKTFNMKNFDILFKTDSCGYTQGDTCELVVKIDSIRYNTVYLSLDELNNKVCGRRWHVDGKLFTTEKLTYTFSDTGTYNIGIWGFAGATTDSTNILIRINQLDSCFSHKKDTCRMKGIINSQVCEKLKFSIDRSISQYCNRYWKIENKLFYQDTVMYTFPSKNTFPVYLVGHRGNTVDIDTILVKVDCMSSINNPEGIKLEIYPNPFNNAITVQSYKKFQNSISISISDVYGRNLITSIDKVKNDKIIINTKSLPKGVYFIHLSDFYTKETILMSKLIKETE